MTCFKFWPGSRVIGVKKKLINWLLQIMSPLVLQDQNVFIVDSCITISSSLLLLRQSSFASETNLNVLLWPLTVDCLLLCTTLTAGTGTLISFTFHFLSSLWHPLEFTHRVFGPESCLHSTLPLWSITTGGELKKKKKWFLKMIPRNWQQLMYLVAGNISKWAQNILMRHHFREDKYTSKNQNDSGPN